MFPKEHIITSGAAVALCVYILGIGFQEFILWIALSTIATVAIDLDHFLLQFLNPKRRHIIVEILKNPKKYRSVQVLRDRLHYPGFGVLRMYAHAIEVAAVIILMVHFRLPYSMPVGISLMTHLLTDIIQTIMCPKHC